MILYIVFISFASLFTQAQLPPDAQKMLDRLPSKTLSLDFVVAKAFSSSDSAQAVRSQAIGIESEYYRALSFLDPKIYLKTSYTKNDSDSLSIVDFRSQSLFSVGFSKNFLTGTALALELNELQYNLDPSNIFFDPRTSGAKVTLSQNLWRDFFGYKSRLDKKTGEYLKEYGAQVFQQSVQDWVTNLVNVYYAVWFSKEQLRATDESLARSKKLLDITKIKLNRGTAEKPDYLQVESSYLESKVRKENAEQMLQQAWRELVTSLKLPREWMGIRASLIPLQLDRPYTRALDLCRQNNITEESRKSSLNQKIWEAKLKASEAKVKSAKNLISPDLKLEASYGSEGDSGSLADRWSDVISGESKEWTVGLTFSMPLGWYTEKSIYSAALSEYESTKALHSKSKTDHEISWTNLCAQLNNLIANRDLLKNSVKNQADRAILEEKRFQLGRVPTLNVIQSGEDKTRSELTYNQAEIDLNKTSWEILKLNGEVNVYLDQIVKTWSNYQL